VEDVVPGNVVDKALKAALIFGSYNEYLAGLAYVNTGADEMSGNEI
jgi:hypothetical protein